jgi:hypothetical protein
MHEELKLSQTGQQSLENKKAACSQAAFAKRRRRKGNLSGKAMHDAVPANAETHGLKKSQFLEEG